MVTTLLLVSALLHASWNAFVKSDADKALSLAWIAGIGGVLSAMMLPFVAGPRPEVWPYLIATTLLQNGYFVLVILSYRHADLSQAYPIARGTAALLAATGSAALGLDSLTRWEWTGIFISSLGIASLAFTARGSAKTIVRGIGYPLASGAFTAAYSLVDGTGARLSGDPIAYVLWMNVCAAPFLPAFLWIRSRRGRISRSAAGFGARLGASLVATASYGLAVWAFAQGSIGRGAVLRETSVLIAAVLGSVVLKEPFGLRRTLSAALILAGFLMRE